jgi:hypothetical protein
MMIAQNCQERPEQALFHHISEVTAPLRCSSESERWLRAPAPSAPSAAEVRPPAAAPARRDHKALSAALRNDHAHPASHL